VLQLVSAGYEATGRHPPVDCGWVDRDGDGVDFVVAAVVVAADTTEPVGDGVPPF
jgi:hypothetical protein